MHTKMTVLRSVAAFERVLEDLAQELIESTDEELLEAARDLGMDPTMRESAAFAGVKYPATPQLSDFFEMPVAHPQQIETERSSIALPRSGRRLPGRKKPPKPPRRGNKSGRA